MGMRLKWLSRYTALSFSLLLVVPAFPSDSTIGTFTDIPNTNPRNVAQASAVCASAAGSQVTLNSGSKVWLAPGARGTFYQDHVDLERGGASLQLSPGYEVRVNGIDFRSDGAASAAILLLDSGRAALAVRSGSVRVASGGVVIAPAVRVGQSLEFAMAQSSGTPPPPGGNGNRNGNTGAGCPCTLCVEGKISIEKGKVYITDELTGAKIELNPNPVVARQLMIQKGQVNLNDPKAWLKLFTPPAFKDPIDDGSRVSACIDVTTPANSDDNTGMVGNVRGFGPASEAGKKINVFPWCGIVTRDKDGKVWITNPTTGLRFQVNPGISKGTLSSWLDKGKKKQQVCITGMVTPPNKDNPMPVLNPNVCFEGKITIEGEGKKQIVTITDEKTGAVVRIENAQQYPASRGEGGFRGKVCGYITTPANANANTGTAITMMPGAKISEIGRKPSDPISSVTGTVTKEKDGTYWVTDPVTGLKFEIIADDAEKKELDKKIDEKATIMGTVKPPAEGKSHPTIEKPKVLSQAGAAPGGGGPAPGGAVVSEVTGSVAVALVALIAVAETNSTSSPTSP
jgi:hypothetical protein